MSQNKKATASIPLPPSVQAHELQFKILREKQMLNRESEFDNASRKSDSSSRRSASQREGDNQYTTGSIRSSSRAAGSAGRTSSTARTSTSITSSVALGKLNKLEEMLIEERRARRGAESMLVALQKERVAREDAVRQSQATRKQLDDLMTALRSVVQKPDDPSTVMRLQSLIDGTRVDPATVNRMRAEAMAMDTSSGPDRFAKNGTSLAPPVDSRYTKKITHSLPAIESSSQRSGGAEKNFLDGLGHFERERERERKQERARRLGTAQK